MRVVWQRIQEKVSKTIPCQVILHLSSRGKNQPIWLDPAALRFPPEISNRSFILPQQPKHAILYAP
jgi:hypothetical protein